MWQNPCESEWLPLNQLHNLDISRIVMEILGYSLSLQWSDGFFCYQAASTASLEHGKQVCPLADQTSDLGKSTRLAGLISHSSWQADKFAWVGEGTYGLVKFHKANSFAIIGCFFWGHGDPCISTDLYQIQHGCGKGFQPAQVPESCEKSKQQQQQT